MNDTTKVFVSIFIGAFIGSFISLELLPNYLFWVGSIIGGITGYFLKDFEKVKEKAPEAWERTTTKMRKEEYGWAIVKRIGNRLLKSFLLPIAIFSPIFCAAFFIYFFFFIFIEEVTIISILVTALLVATMVSSAVLFLGLFGTISLSQKNDKFSYMLLSEWNPISFVFYQIPKAIKWIFTVVIPATAIFFKELFFLVYSDGRLVVGVWASVGALIGFFTGSSLIGASIGAIVGTLNYEILSKRVFDLVPEKNKN